MTGRRRQLGASERALWQAVTESVRPLETIPVAKPVDPAPAKALLRTEPDRSARHDRGAKRSRSAPITEARIPDRRTAPAGDDETAAAGLFGGDPRQARRVARGRRDIDGTLDLHGLTQDEARARLIRFVEFAHLRGDRTLLIITGKGERGPGSADPFAERSPRGILRRRFLEWIEAPPLRGYITQTRTAHQKHGGRGAFYLFLKRKK